MVRGRARPRRLVIVVDGTPLATVYPDGALREYRVGYARPTASDESLQVARWWRTRAARRAISAKLGFVVAAVRWEVDGPPLPWRAGLALVQVGLLGLGYWLFRALRSERWVTPLLIGYTGAATLSWLVASRHPAMIMGLAAIGLLFAVRRGAALAIQPLREAAGQRWLLALAILGISACAPIALEPYNPANNLRGYVAILLIGVATVIWLRDRRAEVALGGYALASGLAAAWWYWLVAPPLAALPGLQLYDQTAIRLVPWAIVVFGAAVAILARLLPGVVGRWILIGDLLAGLLALALPVGAWLVGRGEYSELERTLRVSWPGGLLVLLLVAKAAVCGAALWRGAPGVATGRRVALAVLALGVAVAWSLAPWRMAAMGLSGDEPGYPRRRSAGARPRPAAVE
ncbi:MAG: hypothetical protein U0232_20140 [Thermomicrobiales bacterium]